MIELRALGGLRLRDSADGREILSVLARTKPSALLLYLVLSPPNGSHGRDKLLALLWPDSSTEKARNSLNQALHVLRRGLGPGVIGTTEGGDLFLEAGAVWCDVAAFDEALAGGDAREALELYGGDLWDPSDLSDCPAFERWLDGERRRLCGLAVGAAVPVAQELERDGDVADAAQWLRRARDWAPYDEAVVRPLLKLLYGMGERAAAVTEYDAYEKHLAADLRGAFPWSDRQHRGNCQRAVDAGHLLLRGLRGRGRGRVRHDQQLFVVRPGRCDGATASDHSGPDRGVAFGRRQQPGDGGVVHAVGDGDQQR